MITDAELADFLSASGHDDWGAWRPDPAFPHDAAWSNSRFSVLAMPSGDWTHVMIRPKAGVSEPRWRDRQRIKNDLFGEEAVAIEVMPRQRDVVASGEAYHIWLASSDSLSLPSLAE